MMLVLWIGSAWMSWFVPLLARQKNVWVATYVSQCWVGWCTLLKLRWYLGSFLHTTSTLFAAKTFKIQPPQQMILRFDWLDARLLLASALSSQVQCLQVLCLIWWGESRLATGSADKSVKKFDVKLGLDAWWRVVDRKAGTPISWIVVYGGLSAVSCIDCSWCCSRRCLCWNSVDCSLVAYSNMPENLDPQLKRVVMVSHAIFSGTLTLQIHWLPQWHVRCDGFVKRQEGRFRMIVI